MRKMPLLWCGLVFNAAVLAAQYVPGTSSFARSIVWLPFLIAFLTFGSALYLINGRRLGRVGWDQVWDVLMASPRWARAGLGLLFAVTVVSTVTAQIGVQSDVGFDRDYALGAVWFSAIGTVLHTGLRRGSAPSAGRWSSRIALVLLLTVGAGSLVATQLLSGDPIFDNKATHDRLATRFGDTPWYPHLVAANTDHAAFVVYLDTRDAGVQAEVCTDLTPVAGELGRVPDLYYAKDGHVRFVRSC